MPINIHNLDRMSNHYVCDVWERHLYLKEPEDADFFIEHERLYLEGALPIDLIKELEVDDDIKVGLLAMCLSRKANEKIPPEYSLDMAFLENMLETYVAIQEIGAHIPPLNLE